MLRVLLKYSRLDVLPKFNLSMTFKELSRIPDQQEQRLDINRVNERMLQHSK